MDRLANTVARRGGRARRSVVVGLSLDLSDVLKYPGVPARRRHHARPDRRDPLTAILRRHQGRMIERYHQMGVLGVAMAIGVDCRSAATAVGRASGARGDVDAAYLESQRCC